MRALPIKRALNEDGRLCEITFGGRGTFSLYEGAGDDSDFYYLTDVSNSDIIYMAVSRELYYLIFDEALSL